MGKYDEWGVCTEIIGISNVSDRRYLLFKHAIHMSNIICTDPVVETADDIISAMVDICKHIVHEYPQTKLVVVIFRIIEGGRRRQWCAYGLCHPNRNC